MILRFPSMEQLDGILCDGSKMPNHMWKSESVTDLPARVDSRHANASKKKEKNKLEKQVSAHVTVTYAYRPLSCCCGVSWPSRETALESQPPTVFVIFAYLSYLSYCHFGIFVILSYFHVIQLLRRIRDSVLLVLVCDKKADSFLCLYFSNTGISISPEASSSISDYLTLPSLAA